MHGLPRKRRVRDFPWRAWTVSLIVELHRVRSRRCRIKTERIDFPEGKHPPRAGCPGGGLTLRGCGGEPRGGQVGACRPRQSVASQPDSGQLEYQLHSLGAGASDCGRTSSSSTASAPRTAASLVSSSRARAGATEWASARWAPPAWPCRARPTTRSSATTTAASDCVNRPSSRDERSLSRRRPRACAGKRSPLAGAGPPGSWFAVHAAAIAAETVFSTAWTLGSRGSRSPLPSRRSGR